jgi:hypothetical protein
LGKKEGKFEKSIDGILFENFLTEWDYHREIGIYSPYVKGNFRLLHDTLVEVRKNNPHLQFFFLDYVNPQQADLSLLLHSQKSLLSVLDNPPIAYAHPGLQSIYPKPKELFPLSSTQKMPVIDSLVIKPQSGGTFFVEVLTDQILDSKIRPVLHLSSESKVKKEFSPQYPTYPVTFLRSNSVDGKTKMVYQGEGLEKDKKYYAWFRFVGPEQSAITEFVEADFTSLTGEWPDKIADFTVSGKNESIVLDWAHPWKNALKYEIVGTEKNNKKPMILEVVSPPVKIGGCVNGGTYTFRLRGISKAGVKGPFVFSRSISPGGKTKTTPPPMVTGVEVSEKSGQIMVKWTPVEREIRGYRVYVIPEDQNYRLPLFTKDCQVTTKTVVKGKYKIYVTVVDSSKNEGKLSELQFVTIDN